MPARRRASSRRIWAATALRVAAGLGSALLDRQVVIGAVQAIARQRGDVLVGRPHLGGTAYLHHRADGIVRQLVAGVQRDVVGFAVQPVDDQIAAVVQLVGQTPAATRPTIVRPSSPGSNTASSRGLPLMARCIVRMMSPRSPRARKVSPRPHGRPRCRAAPRRPGPGAASVAGGRSAAGAGVAAGVR